MKHVFSFVASFVAVTLSVFAQCEADHTVDVSSFQYMPADLTIEAGESVAFVNMSGFHDVNGVTNSITGESFGNPAVFSLPAQMGAAGGVCLGVVTFDVPGTYNYDCSIGDHAAQGMVASLTVNAPPTNTVVDIVVNSEAHTTLETAVVAAGLVETLSGEGPFTVFAPTDDAFAALPAGTLDAVLADMDLLTDSDLPRGGGTALSTDLSDGMMVTTLNGADVTVTINADGVFINDAQVTVADVVADNGVVHVIDAVLLPPAPETNTVVDIIVNSESHTVLETAVVAAGLVETLSGEGPFTIFAPTDDAFAALPAGTIEAVLADIDLLTAILTYHVVGGTALSTDLSDGMMVTTLNGADVTVTINADGVFINDAQVIVADLIADNGVVHVIDAVLLPPTPDGIQEAGLNWTLAPNPVKDVLTIQGIQPTATVALLDMFGRTVRQFPQGTIMLNVGDLSPGTYMVAVTEGSAMQVKKVLVQ